VKAITNPKQAAVMQAILEASKTDGLVLKEWQGTKELAASLLPSEYKRILKALDQQGYIEAKPVQLIESKDHEEGGLWPYDITVKTDPHPEGVTWQDTTLIINGHAIKLGRGAHHYTIQYYIASLAMKKPGKAVLELTILEKYGNEEASSRSIVDATRKLNKKIAGATGIERLFECSNGRVSYHPDRLN
jgi:hypothetical protein